jgi:hypothetical protein
MASTLITVFVTAFIFCEKSYTANFFARYKIIPGKTGLRGRLSTVDLLIKVANFVIK